MPSQRGTKLCSCWIDGYLCELADLAGKAGQANRVRILTTNWWTYCADINRSMFSEEGDHAGISETAMIQAIDPKLAHPERYSDSMAMPIPSGSPWTAYPFPTSILLYRPNQGYVKFDKTKADAYFHAVVEKMTGLVKDTIARWDTAGIFENR